MNGKLTSGVVLAVALAFSSPARADDSRGKTHIAVDFDFATAIDAPTTKTGGGGAVRLGRKFDLLLVSFTPELGGGYHGFGGNGDSKLYTGFVGGRFGVGKIVEPSIFSHVGIGRLEGVEARTAPVMDLG